MPSDGGARPGGAWKAAAAYVALTIVLTWPLAAGLTRDVPSDFGDPLLNSWILAWDAHHLLDALGGHPSALARYWHANIFYPHPYALAYSEHLTAQAIQIVPIYALTNNPLLCYNVVFLSTFALSALGMFLFARELTGDGAAAFVAGLAYGFAPYRFGSVPHVQVLSSAWMPFVLLGFRRFFATRRTAPLAGAGAAWIAQNLSCSYYLLFFSPVVALYIAWEMTVRELWRIGPIVRRVALLIAIVGAATLPFVVPYLKLRRLGFMPRSLDETDRFGADVYAYLTADANLRVWGRVMRAWPHAEGWLFPGVTIAILAGVAIAFAWRDARQSADAIRSSRAARALAIGLGASCVTAMTVLFGWTLRLSFAKITSFDRVLAIVVVLAAALLIQSRRARETARRWTSSPVGMLTMLTLFAIAMSFGPHVYSRGRLIEDANLYLFFYDYVPGFDGLRVPARFGMIVALGLAALAAFAIHDLRRTRRGSLIASCAGALIVAESVAVPLPLNGNDTNYKQSGLAELPPFVATGDRTPRVYDFIATLPPNAAILELPAGEVAFDVRYMFYSTRHWRQLLNGYSGGAPVEYGLLTESLGDVFHDPARAWRALTSSGATHVVVHESGYSNRGADVSRWLRERGAREIAMFDRDRVFELTTSR